MIIALVASVLYFGFEVREKIYDGYAAWNTTHAVAAYIVRNDGLLPTKWSDLVNVDPNYDSRDIDRLRKRIDIDFSQKPPRIEIISGRAPAWNRPNEELAELFKETELPPDERKSFYWFIKYDWDRPQAEQAGGRQSGTNGDD